MRRKALDVIEMVDALYRFDLKDDDWLSFVAGELSRLLDPGNAGRVGMMLTCTDPDAFAVTNVVEAGLSDEIQAVFRVGLAGLPPEYLVDGLLTRGWCRGSSLEAWERIPGNVPSSGIADVLQISTVDVDGHGCLFGGFQRERVQLTREVVLALSFLARHLCAVSRLRRRIDEGACEHRVTAVLEPGGRVVDARADARDPAALAELGRAVRAADSARTARGRRDWVNSVRSWPAFVRNEWTLVDRFERDGRRFVVAMENGPAAPSFGLLSRRERDVVRQAALGRNDKEIAYELGIAHSTVRVLMARAMLKTGARGRHDLLSRARREAGRF